jgi:hypothetical protein
MYIKKYIFYSFIQEDVCNMEFRGKLVKESLKNTNLANRK